MWNISLPSPKFIWQYLPARINRGQKSTPYARVSHKQGRSRSTSRKGRGSPLVLIAEVFRDRVYKRDALVRGGYFAPSPPLIPKVHKYWKGVYSPKGRSQDRSCTPWHGIPRWRFNPTTTRKRALKHRTIFVAPFRTADNISITTAVRARPMNQGKLEFFKNSNSIFTN